jgi:hypothetical protein
MASTVIAMNASGEMLSENLCHTLDPQLDGFSGLVREGQPEVGGVRLVD